MSRRRGVRFATFRADVGPLRYFVTCRIHPRILSSRDGPDGRHYMAPGKAAWLEIVRVRRDGFDVTDSLDADLGEAMRARCSQLAGISRVFLPHKAEQAALEFTT